MRWIWLLLCLVAFSSAISQYQVDAAELARKQVVVTATVGDVVRVYGERAGQSVTYKSYQLQLADVGDSAATFYASFETKVNSKTVGSGEVCSRYSPKCTLSKGAANKEFVLNDVAVAYLVSVNKRARQVTLKFGPKKRTSTCKELKVAGDPKTKINVLLVPGRLPGSAVEYSEAQFKKDALAALSTLFSVQNFGQYAKDFNFYYQTRPLSCFSRQNAGSASRAWDCRFTSANEICPYQDVAIAFIPAQATAGGSRALIRSTGSDPVAFAVSRGFSVFAHEFMHNPLQLYDEYCCDGGYLERWPHANVYKGSCNYLNKQFTARYGSTTSCKSFTSIAGQLWSHPAAEDIMSNHKLLRNSIDNQAVIKAVIAKARSSK